MRKSTRWLAGIGLCIGAWSGSARLPAEPPAAASAVGLGPRTSLCWSIDAAGKAVMSGEGEVAPNGMLEVGPYGSVAVGGLTLEQARSAVEKHVAAHVSQARVSLYLASAVPVRIEGGQPDARILPVAAEAPAMEEPAEARPLGPVLDALPLDETVPLVETGAPASQQWRTLAPSALPPEATAGLWRPVGAMPAGGPMQVSDPGTELHVAPRPLPEHGPHGVIGGPHPVPRENARVSLPPYVIDPPDVLLVQSNQKNPDQAISGPHLVRPDGTISLGIYGTVHVRGLTLEQARAVIAAQIMASKRIQDFNINSLVVDVLQYNSKFYYVITDGGGTNLGEQVVRFRIEGSETVLDALGQINGLSPVSSRKDIWVARAVVAHHPQILPVDWIGITQRADTSTNYQVMPGDRIYVKAQKLVRVDSALGKVLHPIERLFGITFLGSSTVNSIKGNNQGGGGGF